MSKNRKQALPLLGQLPMDRLFPFHFVWNRAGELLHVGPSLKKLLANRGGEKDFIRSLATVRPKMNWNFEEVSKFLDYPVMLSSDRLPILLQGQTLLSDDPDTLIFIGTPYLLGKAHFHSVGLKNEDFAPHDPSPHYVSMLDEQKSRLLEARLEKNELARSENWYRTIFREAEEGISVVDRDYRIIELNPRLLSLTKYDLGDIVGSPISRLVHPEDHALLRSRIQDRREGRRGDVYELRIVASDGEVFTFLNSISPMYERGTFVGALGFHTNVTDLKQVERSLVEEKARAAFASKMAALGEMAGGIAHEINNPLAIIHGRSRQLKNLALQGQADSSLVAQVSQRIEDTAMRISKIILSLMAFAREGEQDPTRTEPVKKILNDTLEFCRSRFFSHDILLHVDFGPENLSVECRPVQISQVLLNLLNNAHDAVEHLSEKWVQVSVTENGDSVQISVEDSGPGVAYDLKERIFEPFFTTKQVGEGTGLGLSVSKSIVESHFGRISLDLSGSHTRFVVSIPKTQKKALLQSAA